MRQGELHLQLEILAKEFRENPSDETGDRILAAMAKIIRDNEKILICIKSVSFQSVDKQKLSLKCINDML